LSQFVSGPVFRALAALQHKILRCARYPHPKYGCNRMTLASI
jgi:hypothetical protein